MTLLIFIIGLSVGSFLNVVILRLHEQKNFIKGRSMCPKCKALISWYDNIPLISFILLKGKCRSCKAKISWQYPILELVTALLFLLIWHGHGGSVEILSDFRFQISDFRLLRDLFFTCILIIIFVYDLRWYLILDVITIPAILLAFTINVLLGFSFLNLLLAIVIGAGFFLIQFVVSKGKWIGGGDIRMGALMGAMLGFPQICTAIFIAYIFGSLVGITLLASRRKKLSSQIPFGTFLSAGAVIVLVYGKEILAWYLNFIY